MNSENGLSCPQCATARDIYRYCMNCGFDFAEIADISADNAARHLPAEASNAPYAQPDVSEPKNSDTDTDTAERPVVAGHPVLPPPADSAAPGSQVVGGSSAPLMLGIIAGAICLLLVLGVAIVSVIGDDENEPSDSASQATSSPEADNSTSPSPAGEECWDGSAADSVNDCPIPSGTKGLAWVFPSFDPTQCTDKTEGSQPPRWTCAVNADDGGKVRVRYREHGSLERAQATYSQEYGVRNRTEVLSPREDVERYVWRAPTADNDGLWSVSSMYAEHPWSVTVVGRRSADVETVFSDVVQFRNPRRIPT